MSGAPVSPFSRRVAMFRIAGGGIAAALATRGPALAVAQEATPMAGETPAVIQEWVDAWNANDVDRLVGLFADDALYEEIPTGITARGHEEIRAAFQETLTALSDIEVTAKNTFSAGDWAVLEGTFGGTQVGSIGEISPTGQSFTAPFAAIFELENGKIRRETDYYDLFGILVQLGVIIPPGMEVEGTPVA